MTIVAIYDTIAKYSMLAIVTGAVINIVLDALFMYGFEWGIAGAAWATIIGQVVSAILLMLYFPRFRTVKFETKDFVPRGKYLIQICKLGMSSFIFQGSMLISTTAISTVIFLLFQCFPKQIMGMFGEGSETYFEFATIYARGFTAVMFLNGIQTSCTTFFPSIGKAWKGSVISLSKQLVLLVPLLILFANRFGVDGIIYATPVSDALAFMLAASLLYFEMKHMPKEDVI